MVSSRYSSGGSIRRSSSVLRSGRFSKGHSSSSQVGGNGGSRYLENAVVAYEEFGEAQKVLKLYEFRDKRRTSEKLGKNVLIKIEASTVSMTDVLIRRDLWHQKVKHPCKSGCDLVGRVINAGSGCQDVKIGDRVCSLGLALGGNAKYAILPATRVFCCPEDIHPTTVACLARTYMAAYQCLHRAGGIKIRPGNKVLIIGGAGSLGQALIQLAIAAGADEIYATGKGSNSKRIIENLGAQALGRKPGEWLPYVKGEMDIVIDSVCADDYVSSLRAVKRKTGKLICVGATAIATKSYNWNNGLDPKDRFRTVELASSMSQTSFYDVFSSLEMKRDVFRKDLFRLFHLCRNNEITPKVAFCVPLNEVANAQLDLEAGGIDGTIVCLPFGPEGREVSTQESDVDITHEYDDGIQVRESTMGGKLESLFGKVMKDGTFKILSSTKRGFDAYDDDEYSRFGGSPDRSRHPDLKRVDSSPFALQDDMDRSYHRAMFDDDEEDEEDTHFSSYRNKSRYDDDKYGRQGPNLPRGGRRAGSSRRVDDMDELDQHVNSSRNRVGSHSNYSGGLDRHSRSNRRSAGRSSRSRMDTRGDDDIHGSRRRQDSQDRNFEDPYNASSRSNRRRDDDDVHNNRKPPSHRSASRGFEEEDNYGEIRPSRSRGGGSSRFDIDDGAMEIKRSSSILRNGDGARSQSRGPKKASSKRSEPEPSSHGRSRSRAKRTDSVPRRARSRSRDPRGPRSSSRPRGRTRSRSEDTRYAREDSHQRSASEETERSQSTTYTRDSEHTRGSVYSAKSDYSADTRGTEYTPEEREKSRRHKKEKKSKKSEPQRLSSKGGLFSRFRSKSNRRGNIAVTKIKKEMKKASSAVQLKEKRSSSLIPRKEKSKKEISRAHSSSRHVNESKHRGESKHRSSSKHRGDSKHRSSSKHRSPSKHRSESKHRSDSRHRSPRKEKSRRDNDRHRDSRQDYDDTRSLVDDDESEYYEEEAVRSVVSLNCVSDDTISSDEEKYAAPPKRSASRRAESSRSSTARMTPRSSSRARSSSRRR